MCGCAGQKYTRSEARIIKDIFGQSGYNAYRQPSSFGEHVSSYLSHPYSLQSKSVFDLLIDS